jgi:hypothetical protein
MLDKTTDPKMQLQTMTLLMQLYGSIMSMAAGSEIVQKAMEKVEQLQGKTKLQNTELTEVQGRQLNDTEESSSDEPIEPEEDIEKGKE